MTVPDFDEPALDRTLELVVRQPRHYHVSQDTVAELETAILRDVRVAPARMNAVAVSAIVAATMAAARMGINAATLVGKLPGRHQTDHGTRDYFAVMMGIDITKCAPWFVLPARRSVYLFDAWPSKHREIVHFVKSWGVQYAFVSSSQAAQRLSVASDSCTFIWVPEGIDAEQYRARTPGEKDIDVLQLGRKHQPWHDMVHPASAGAFSYLYEETKGQIIFPERRDFVEGLGRAKISICFPSSITHPERAGDIETMTVRYLQSIASKCLIVGRAPAEMIELFGYNPVIDADMSDPAGQIKSILRNYQDYASLVERNYDAVVREHTWKRRWERMSAILLPHTH